MYEVLIREAGARFGLGDKALSVVQVLMTEMTDKDKGGLAGFLEPFKAAGFGPIIQSWLGGGPSAQPISNRQLEEVLGTSGGLLSSLSARLDVDRDALTSALGYLLPALVGKLSIGGSVPSHYPPEALDMAEAGRQLLAGPAPSEGPGSAGFFKWLPWLVLIVAIILGVSYYNKAKHSADGRQQPAVITLPQSSPAPSAGTESAPAALPESRPAADADADAPAADSGQEAASSEPAAATDLPADSEDEPAASPAEMPAAGENT